MSIQEFIARVSEKLTPTERRVAALVLEDPTLLAFGTVSDLAAQARTSRPSIVRFATKLGFDGYSDLQSWVRQELSNQITSPSHRIRHQGESIGPIRSAIDDAVHHAFSALDEDRLIALATPIAKAPNIWILSGETSMAGARVLHSGLSMIRPNVHFVEEHSAGRELSSATPEDTAVVFDFARYRRNPITSAQALSELGTTIVAITDGALSPLASLTDTWCELKIPAVGPFDSSIPSVIAAEIIVFQVVQLMGTEALKRIDRLEELWQRTGTFLNYSPRRTRDS